MEGGVWWVAHRISIGLQRGGGGGTPVCHNRQCPSLVVLAKIRRAGRENESEERERQGGIRPAAISGDHTKKMCWLAR